MKKSVEVDSTTRGIKCPKCGKGMLVTMSAPQLDYNWNEDCGDFTDMEVLVMCGECLEEFNLSATLTDIECESA